MAKPLKKLELTNPRFHIFDGLSIQRIPAPFLQRFMAYVNDLSIVTAILYLLLIVGLIFSVPVIAFFANLVSDKIITEILLVLLIIVVIAVFISVYHGYFVYYEYKKGQTLGKKAFALQVVSERGNKLSLRQCVLREALRYIDCTLIFPGLISILVSKKHQRLGDLACGTLVIHLPKKEKEQQFLYITPQQYHLYVEALQAPEVEAKTAQNYLSFAYPHYISKTQIATFERKREILQNLKAAIPQAEKLAVEDESLLLFFAEHCHQQFKK